MRLGCRRIAFQGDRRVMKGTVVIALVALMIGVAGGVWYASQAADANAGGSRMERLYRESALDIRANVKLLGLIRRGETELAVKYLETLLQGAEITLQGVEDSIPGERRTVGRKAVDHPGQYRAKSLQKADNSP